MPISIRPHPQRLDCAYSTPTSGPTSPTSITNGAAPGTDQTPRLARIRHSISTRFGLNQAAVTPPGSPQIVRKKEILHYQITTGFDPLLDPGRMAHVIRHNIPSNRDYDFQRQVYSVTRLAKPGERDFSMELDLDARGSPHQEPLKDIKLTDRLNIIAHGSASHVEINDEIQVTLDAQNNVTSVKIGSISHLKATGLAPKLFNAGLREVGVIKLSSCNAGTGRLLEDLLFALDQLNVNVGYVSGPRGEIADVRMPVKIGAFQTNLRRMGSRALFRKAVFLNDNLWYPRPERFGLRVVKGNVDLRFPGTRYDLPPVPEQGST